MSELVYPVPCYYCGADVKAHQPKMSKFPIETVHCKDCQSKLKRMKEGELRALIKRKRERDKAKRYAQKESREK